PSGAFAGERRLAVEAGPGIAVTATEHASDTSPRTELADFDPASGRFVIDKVVGIEGDSANLWVATARGIDHMRIGRDRRLEQQSKSSKLISAAALRRDARGALCAFDGVRGVWRFDGSAWRGLAAGSPDNPFFAPVRGAVSRL